MRTLWGLITKIGIQVATGRGRIRHELHKNAGRSAWKLPLSLNTPPPSRAKDDAASAHRSETLDGAQVIEMSRHNLLYALRRELADPGGEHRFRNGLHKTDAGIPFHR